jgi:hypothetical protein
MPLPARGRGLARVEEADSGVKTYAQPCDGRFGVENRIVVVQNSVNRIATSAD